MVYQVSQVAFAVLFFITRILIGTGVVWLSGCKVLLRPFTRSRGAARLDGLARGSGSPAVHSRTARAVQTAASGTPVFGVYALALPQPVLVLQNRPDRPARRRQDLHR